MAARVNFKLDLELPPQGWFSRLVQGERTVKQVQRAIHEAVFEMAEEGVEFIKEEIHPGAGYDTGKLYDSHHAVRLKNFSAAAVSDDRRPIKTWIERGTRRGKKLRRGQYVYTHARTKVRRLRASDYLERKVLERLR